MGTSIERLHGGLRVLTCGRVPELWVVELQDARCEQVLLPSFAHSCFLSIVSRRVDVEPVENARTQLCQLAFQLNDLRTVSRNACVSI